MSGYRDVLCILGVFFYFGNWFLLNVFFVFLIFIVVDCFLVLYFCFWYCNMVILKKIVIVLVIMWFVIFVGIMFIIYDNRIYNIVVNFGLVVCLLLIIFCYLKIYLIF